MQRQEEGRSERTNAELFARGLLDGAIKSTTLQRIHHPIKNPGPESGVENEGNAVYRLSFRLTTPARPIRPVPSMVSVPGSGTTLVLPRIAASEFGVMKLICPFEFNTKP